MKYDTPIPDWLDIRAWRKFKQAEAMHQKVVEKVKKLVK